VTPGEGGPSFALDGELNSVKELVDAILASPDLVALLSADQAAVLKAAAAENLDSIPALVEYVGERRPGRVVGPSALFLSPFAALCARTICAPRHHPQLP
jgi:hypothetical protein